jgi:hypothetical protein
MEGPAHSFCIKIVGFSAVSRALGVRFPLLPHHFADAALSAPFH